MRHHYFLLITLIFSLYSTIANATLVDLLENTSLCRSALTQEARESSNISCHTLRIKFQTIDNNASYRSFKRSLALWKSQKIINDLHQAVPESKDILKLKTAILREVDKNIKAMRNLKLNELSLLSRYKNRPLDNGEVFFIRVEKSSDGRSLYFIEGRKYGELISLEEFEVNETLPTNIIGDSEEIAFISNTVPFSISQLPELKNNPNLNNVFANSFFKLSTNKVELPPSAGRFHANDYIDALISFSKEMHYFLTRTEYKEDSSNSTYEQNDLFRFKEGEKIDKKIYEVLSPVNFRTLASISYSSKVHRPLSKGEKVKLISIDEREHPDSACLSGWLYVEVLNPPAEFQHTANLGWVCRSYLREIQ